MNNICKQLSLFKYLVVLAMFLGTPLFPQAGNALHFDGSNDYVTLSNSINLSGSSFTYECWFKWPNPNGEAFLVSCGSPNGGSGQNSFIMLNYQAGDPPFFPEQSYINYGFYGFDKYYNYTFDANWHHIAFSYNAGNQQGKLYIDGSVVDSTTYSGLNFSSSGSNTLGYACWVNSSPPGPSEIYLDEVRIWNVVRTATEISDNKNNTGLSTSSTGLLAYYHFDQGTGGSDNSGITTLNDATSNGYNGTLNNFALNGTISNWVSSDAPLPVELSSFNVVTDNGKVLLNWTTANEVSNYGFEIERVAGIAGSQSTWQKIGFIPGSGNSNVSRNYSFTDQPSAKGLYSYRLKQIDFDGSFSYSKAVATMGYNTPGEFSLQQNYPNPFNPSTKIRYSIASTQNVKLVVYDLLGNEIKVLVNGVKQQGTYEVTFEAGNLPAGIYIYKLSAGEFNKTGRMLLLK